MTRYVVQVRHNAHPGNLGRPCPLSGSFKVHGGDVHPAICAGSQGCNVTWTCRPGSTSQNEVSVDCRARGFFAVERDSGMRPEELSAAFDLEKKYLISQLTSNVWGRFWRGAESRSGLEDRMKPAHRWYRSDRCRRENRDALAEVASFVQHPNSIRDLRVASWSWCCRQLTDGAFGS